MKRRQVTRQLQVDFHVYFMISVQYHSEEATRRTDTIESVSDNLIFWLARQGEQKLFFLSLKIFPRKGTGN